MTGINRIGEATADGRRPLRIPRGFTLLLTDARCLPYRESAAAGEALRPLLFGTAPRALSLPRR